MKKAASGHFVISSCCILEGGGVELQPGRSKTGAERLSRSQAKKPSHTALLLISKLFSPNFVKRDTIKALSCT